MSGSGKRKRPRLSLGSSGGRRSNQAHPSLLENWMDYTVEEEVSRSIGSYIYILLLLYIYAKLYCIIAFNTGGFRSEYNRRGRTSAKVYEETTHCRNCVLQTYKVSSAANQYTNPKNHEPNSL